MFRKILRLPKNVLQASNIHNEEYIAIGNALRRALCLQADNGFCRACAADSEKQVFQSRFDVVLRIKCMNTFNTQEYRSGHNEAVLKTVGLTARGFEYLFLRQKKPKSNTVRFRFLSFLAQE